MSLLAQRAEANIIAQYNEEQEELQMQLSKLQEESEAQELEQKRLLEAQERERKMQFEREKRELESRLKRLNEQKRLAIIDSQLQVYDVASQASNDSVFSDKPCHVNANVIVQDTNNVMISQPPVSIAQKVNADCTNVPDIHPRITKSTVENSYPVMNTRFRNNLSSNVVACNHVPNKVNTTQACGNDVVFNNDSTVRLMAEVLNNSRLPNVSVAVFDGSNPIDYAMWKTSFECLIESSTDDPVRRLSFLCQYTSGQAQLLVKSFMYKPTVENYLNAKLALDKEYGNKFVLSRAYMSKIDSHKVVTINDIVGLQSFSTLLSSVLSAMDSIEPLSQLNMDLSLQRIVLKLPAYMQTAWRNQAFELELKGQMPDFSALVKFVEKEAIKARHPIFSSHALNLVNPNGRNVNVNNNNKSANSGIKPVKVLLTSSEQKGARSDGGTPSAKSGGSNSVCKCCSKSYHDLDKCRQYLSMHIAQRQAFIREHRLCFACYKPTTRDHIAKTCKHKRRCETCSGKHPTGLHDSEFRPKTGKAPDPVNVNQAAETAVKTLACAINFNTIVPDNKILMSTVLVQLRLKDKIVTTYAALDSLSSACFISKSLWMDLGSQGEPVQISVKTLNSEVKQSTMMIKGLRVSSLDGDQEIAIPKAYVQDQLAIESSEIANHAVLNAYPHLRRLVTEVPDRVEGLSVGLLLGINCNLALEPLECIYSDGSGPTAVRTRLGWMISGSTNLAIDKENNNRIKCNFLSVNDPAMSMSRTIPDMLQRMYDADFIESVTENSASNNETYVKSVLQSSYSYNDKRFVELMQSEVKIEQGHYVLPLAFQEGTVTLRNNREMALRRLQGLKSKFNKNPDFRGKYSKFMQEMLDLGYAKKSDVTETDAWYVPHHSVSNPHKPDKFRVVWDCSAEYQGLSLNKSLMSGPDLTSSLAGVLVRFRQEPIAVIADIKSMFFQIKIPEAHQRYLKFVWWPDGDTRIAPLDYQMTVHLFGATSSPSSANFALHQTALDNESRFGYDARQTLLRNFYVDDLLKSLPDVETATRQISAVYNMCKSGGFQLTKFVSNDERSLEYIPIEDRAEPTSRVNLASDSDLMQTVLGVCWLVATDELSFKLALKDKPPTRRGLLSVISSVFDPLGFVAPYLLKGKLILQRLCHAKLDWDTPIGDAMQADWESWRRTLSSLESVRIRRCFKPPDFEGIASVSLHHFCDASQVAYGLCSYIRMTDLRGHVHCSLVLGKSRVAPSRPITVPRLELTAATVAVKYSKLLSKELEYDNLPNYFWTDSTAVLGYIANDVKRFHVFVANRVQYIRDNSVLEHWRYVKSAVNPADDASRGLDFDEMSMCHRWFKGPAFLWEPDDKLFSAQTVQFVTSDEDPELKKADTAKCFATELVVTCRLEGWFKRYSNWYILKKHFAWIMIVFLQLKSKLQRAPLRDMSQCLAIEELKRAEMLILKYVQACCFKSELHALGNKIPLSASSKLYRLDPELTPDGLLCVGGRLRRGDLNQESKHPIILPNSHHVTELLVQYYHVQSCHSGKEFVRAAIGKRFWIFGVRRILAQVRKRCFTCKRLFDKPLMQKMSDLPEDRLEPGLPPFSNVGVDLFGPIYVKIGRSLVKRYGCLFTCLTIRAIHLEVAHSLDTDSFINALQRFICRRGQPKLMRSDNGSNIVGAQRELRDAVRQFNGSRMTAFCQQKEIEWIFNPPYASHMGGIWERQIRTVRKVLSTLMTAQHLTDESLQTLFCIVEYTVNSRPLSIVSDDPADLDPLTANHLLQLRQEPVYPPGVFVKQDTCSRRRWRQIQYLADIFWKRWKAEYLPILQIRSKWLSAKCNLHENDLVLLVDLDAPRYQWTLGRVIRTIPSKDGLVRTVEIKTKSGTFVKPIHKLCLLENSNKDTV